jgi:hypothetical protein
MTKSGQKMWTERIRLDHKHVYLIYRPEGFYSTKDQLVKFLPLHKANVSARMSLAWDGSLQTRLMMVRPNDVIIKRFDVDVKND